MIEEMTNFFYIKREKRETKFLNRREIKREIQLQKMNMISFKNVSLSPML